MILPVVAVTEISLVYALTVQIEGIATAQKTIRITKLTALAHFVIISKILADATSDIDNSAMKAIAGTVAHIAAAVSEAITK